jgi:outer membrane protein OmpA-like peptidoglycan-associated protein
MTLGACANNPNQRAMIGAGSGAVGGALLGTLVGGDDRRNALVGAGIGLLAGGAVGAYLDAQERQLQQNLAGTGADLRNEGDRLVVNFPAGLTFQTDSAEISPDFVTPLTRVAQTLREYPQSYIDIIGHTDSTGSADYNQALSERRANAVGNFLRSRGVMPERIVTYGVGQTQPVATNATVEGRAANRRVEMTIIPAQAN